ncbi:MAG: FtsX-like permease family protein, partial [Acidimicrobiia bacterium]
TALAASVLFIAGFLIYLTLSTAVAERIKVHGTMQAVGARPVQIGSLVVVEAIAISIPAGLVGLGLGLLFARLGLALSGRFLGEFGTTIVVLPQTVAIALGMGVLVTVLSALVPARRAARMDPVDAMRGDYATERRLSRGWIVGVALFAAGLALGWKTSSAARVGGATLLITFASVLLVPPILRPAAQLLGLVTERIARGVGRIAVLHLARERTRSAYTLALVMIVMALILATAATNTSFRISFDRLLDDQFGADFELRSASTFTEDFRSRLEALPGVESTTPVWIGASRLIKGDGEEKVLVSFIDPDSYFRVSSFSFIKGDKAGAENALREGAKVIFPMATAERLGLDLGDEITLVTAGGEKRFEIATLIRSPNSLTTMFLGAADGRTHFNLDRPLALQVKV